MSPRRAAAASAVAGAALFLLCCLLVRGGLLDSAAYGDVHLYHTYGERMAHGEWPYRNFFDEYPPLAQPLFWLVTILPGSYATAFKVVMTLCGMAALAALVAALAARRARPLRLAVAAVAAGVAPILVGPIFLNAYDLWPAFLTAAALLALVRGRERAAYVLLALAVAAKLYPVVLLPLALIETWERGGRERLRAALGWFLGVLLVVHLPFALTGPGGLRFSYWVQVKRGLEIESLGGGVLLVLDRLGIHHVATAAEPPGSTNVVGGLGDAVGAVSSLVSLVAILFVAWLYLRSRQRRPLLAAAAAVLAFVAFGKVLSPQYVDWLVPLVPAAGAAASAVLLAALGLTRVVFDHFHSPGGPSGEHYKQALACWVLVRDLLLVALYGMLVARLVRSARSSPP